MAKDFALKTFQEFHSLVLLFHVSHVIFLDWLLRTKDPHFQEMRTNYTVPFLQNFNMGCAPRKLSQLISWNGGNHRKPTCFSLYGVPFGLGEFDLCCSLAAEGFWAVGMGTFFTGFSFPVPQQVPKLLSRRVAGCSNFAFQDPRHARRKGPGKTTTRWCDGVGSKTTFPIAPGWAKWCALAFYGNSIPIQGVWTSCCWEKKLSPGWTVKVLVWFWVVGPANGVWRLFSGTRILDLDFMQAQAPEWWRGRNSAELTYVTLQNLVASMWLFCRHKVKAWIKPRDTGRWEVR